MVKGNSRQVIVVHAPEQKLFDQAIFILREDALHRGGVTEDRLLEEATHLLRAETHQGRFLWRYGPVWACAGALLMGAVWLLTIFV